MAHFTKLPLELLEMIYDHLPTQALSALSMTCTRLQYTVEPSLYKNVSLSFRNGHHPPACQKFLEALLKRPHLNKYIGSLAFIDWDYTFWSNLSYSDDPGDPPYPLLHEVPDTLRLFQPHLEELISTHCAQNDNSMWLKDYNAGDPTAIATLIMLLAVNLKDLILCPSFYKHSNTVRDLLRHSSHDIKGSPSLKHLRQISFSKGQYSIANEVLFSAKMFGDLLYLRNIEQLNFEVLRGALDWPSKQESGTSTLQTLKLPQWSSITSWKCISNLLSSVPHLTTLEMSMPFSWDPQEWADSRVCACITTGLYSLRDNLQNLTLYVVPGAIIPVEAVCLCKASEYELERLFTYFRKLQKLRIHLTTLYGLTPLRAGKMFELLPLGLKELCLSIRIEVNSWIALNMEPKPLRVIENYLIRVREINLPLEKFTLELDSFGPPLSDFDLNFIQKYCEECGIVFTFLFSNQSKVSDWS